MENLNAENIINEIQSLIKALKDCGGWVKRGNGEGWFNHEILVDALALIKELTEENERLRGFNSAKCEDCAGCISNKCDCANLEDKVRADTVRKYREGLYRELASLGAKDKFNKELFLTKADQIAKEMLEGV